MSDDPRHLLGATGERLAAEHLERLGYRILARNFRTRRGELDIIAVDRERYVFVEVKTRRNDSGTAFECVGLRKQERIRRLAIEWMCAVRDRPGFSAIRFDVIAVVLDASGQLLGLDHREGVF